MKTTDFVCMCLGIDGDVIDNICDEFDVDLEDSDVLSAVGYSSEENSWGAGIELLIILFDKIIDKYEDSLDKEKFSFDFSSPSYPCFYYDEEEFATKEKLDKIVEEKGK